MSVTANVTGGITRLLEEGIPDLVSPVVPPAQVYDYEQEQHMFHIKRLAAYTKELPFTPNQVQTIIKNLALTEALTAEKSSDRLAALNLVGKGATVNYFAAEKRTVKLTSEALKESIEHRLERLFGPCVDGEIVESE